MKYKIFILLSLTLLLSGCGCENKKNNEENNNSSKTEINNNSSYQEIKKVDNLEFTDAILLRTDGEALFEVTVKNMGDDLNLSLIKITLLDKDDKALITLDGYIGDSILKDESKVISSYFNNSIKDVTDVKYEIVK